MNKEIFAKPQKRKNLERQKLLPTLKLELVLLNVAHSFFGNHTHPEYTNIVATLYMSIKHPSLDSN